MKLYIYILMSLFLSGLVLVGCSDDDKDGLVVNLSLENAQRETNQVMFISLKDNETMQLVPFFMPTNVANKNVSYERMGTEIFDVDQNGLLTPLKIGVDTIIVRALDGSGVFVKYPVRVVSSIVLVTSITVKSSGLDVQIEKGETFDLAQQVTVNPSDATDQSVSYKSSDETVATIDANGIITAVGEIGQTTTIVITSNDEGKKSAKSNVTIVAEAPPYANLINTSWVLSSNLDVKEGSLDNLLDDDNTEGTVKSFWAPAVLKRPIYSPVCYLNIDMGTVEKLGQFGLRLRSHSSPHLHPHTFKLEAKKTEGDAWTDLGEHVTDWQERVSYQLYQFIPMEARYVRITFIKGHLKAGKTDWDYEDDGNFSLGDISLFKSTK